MTRDKAEALGIKPLGIFRRSRRSASIRRSWASARCPAIRKLLAKTKLTVKDIDLFEMNEAFASQAVYCQNELGIPDEKLNVNGGAIALGHPLGCTGAKLTATALHELTPRRKVRGRHDVHRRRHGRRRALRTHLTKRNRRSRRPVVRFDRNSIRRTLFRDHRVCARTCAISRVRRT